MLMDARHPSPPGNFGVNGGQIADFGFAQNPSGKGGTDQLHRCQAVPHRHLSARMQHRHPRLTSIEVPGEGHAPLLQDAPTIDAITAFFADADSTMHSAAG